MPSAQELHDTLDQFGRAYNYDVRYMQVMLDASQAAFEAFAAAQPLSGFRERLPLDAHFVARISIMQAEDCGACAQLNLRMALEAGVKRALLETLISQPAELPASLQDVREHALGVARGLPPDGERMARLRTTYGADGIAELAVCMVGARIYPTLKRSMGEAQTCQPLTLDV